MSVKTLPGERGFDLLSSSGAAGIPQRMENCTELEQSLGPGTELSSAINAPALAPRESIPDFSVGRASALAPCPSPGSGAPAPCGKQEQLWHRPGSCTVTSWSGRGDTGDRAGPLCVQGGDRSSSIHAWTGQGRSVPKAWVRLASHPPIPSCSQLRVVTGVPAGPGLRVYPRTPIPLCSGAGAWSLPSPAALGGLSRGSSGNSPIPAPLPAPLPEPGIMNIPPPLAPAGFSARHLETSGMDGMEGRWIGNVPPAAPPAPFPQLEFLDSGVTGHPWGHQEHLRTSQNSQCKWQSRGDPWKGLSMEELPWICRAWC